jgi:hypothetical protein
MTLVIILNAIVASAAGGALAWAVRARRRAEPMLLIATRRGVRQVSARELSALRP